MHCIQRHLYIQMQNMQQMRNGHSNRMISSREFHLGFSLIDIDFTELNFDYDTKFAGMPIIRMHIGLATLQVGQL